MGVHAQCSNRARCRCQWAPGLSQRRARVEAAESARMRRSCAGVFLPCEEAVARYAAARLQQPSLPQRRRQHARHDRTQHDPRRLFVGRLRKVREERPVGRVLLVQRGERVEHVGSGGGDVVGRALVVWYGRGERRGAGENLPGKSLKRSADIDSPGHERLKPLKYIGFVQL